MSDIKESIRRFGEDLKSIIETKKYVVFLCGPRIDLYESDSGALLRKRIKEELEREGFEVILGEDDGLEELRKQYSGLAHDNELLFIKNQTNTVVLVAGSVGSFCELGLFSHHHVVENERRTDFILIMDEKYRDDSSYVNEGPAKAISTFGGALMHGDFSSFDISPVMERLKRWRNVWSSQGRGGNRR